MKAVVLAGGRGTRLRPYTTVFPKPMVPVGERPILEIILRQLQRAGIHDVRLSVGYLSELIRAYFDTPREGIEKLRIRYVYEPEPTGTAGALKLIDGLDDTFLFMNGDVLTTMPFNELIDFHRREGGVLTIATHERPVPVDLGVLETDAGNRVLRYVEKPTLHYRVSMGVYVLEPSALAHIPDRTHFDFPDLVHALLDADCKVVGYPSNHFWLDIGRHEDYEAAVDAFEARRGEFGFE
jgi:NDP-sugar pyrophosphorylase family protein